MGGELEGGGCKWGPDIEGWCLKDPAIKGLFNKNGGNKDAGGKNGFGGTKGCEANRIRSISDSFNRLSFARRF